MTEELDAGIKQLSPDGASIQLESNGEWWHARWKGLHGAGPTIKEALGNLGQLMEDAYGQ